MPLGCNFAASAAFGGGSTFGGRDESTSTPSERYDDVYHQFKLDDDAHNKTDHKSTEDTLNNMIVKLSQPDSEEVRNKIKKSRESVTLFTTESELKSDFERYQRVRNRFVKKLLMCMANPSRETALELFSEIKSFRDLYDDYYALDATFRETLQDCYFVTARYLHNDCPQNELTPNPDAKRKVNQYLLQWVNNVLQKYAHEETPFFGAAYRAQKTSVLTAFRIVLEANGNDETANANLREILEKNPDYGHTYSSDFSRASAVLEEVKMLYPHVFTAVDVFVGTVVVEPEQQLKNDLQAELAKLRGEHLSFLGNTKQKIRVLETAFTFVNAKEKDVDAFAKALSDNPDYASGCNTGNPTETVRLVRELVTLYPEVRADLEARKLRLQAQHQAKVTRSASGPGLFDKMKHALSTSPEKKKLMVLETLMVPNAALQTAVTGTVAGSGESGKSVELCAV